MLSILLPALLVGSLLGLLAAPLGCIMMWRRMSFFSDSLAHASMLGVALAAVWHLPLWLGAITVALMVGFGVWALHDRRLPADAILAMVASVLLCLGIIITNFSSELRSQLFNLLLGDILLVSKQDVLWLLLIIPFCIGLLLYHWRAQVLCALDEELAASNGIKPRLQLILFIFILCIFCVAGLKAIGSLLIGAILVIPALAARLIAHSPQSMALFALVFNIVCLIIGLALSAKIDIPAGPTVVVAMGSGFLLTFIFKKFVNLDNT